ncbi:hypothetical protein ABIE69_001446 [Rhodobacteraceae bacterium MBR-64]|jgi:hypothetical protein
MKNLACNEEDQELIRGINSRTNAPPEPVPGMTQGAKVRSKCGECPLQILRAHSAPDRSVVSCAPQDADIAWISRNQ